MSKPRRVALYYRVSTDKQDAEIQIPQLRAYCDQRGWTNRKEYIDDPISGASTSRDKLDEMMLALRAGRHDLVLIQSYDRFGRDEIHLILTMDELVKRGIDFVSVQESIDTTSDIGRMAFIMFAAMAGFVRRQIGKKTKAALAVKKAQGVRLGRPVVPADLRARVLELHAQGQSLQQISDQIIWVRASGKYGKRKEANLSKSGVKNIVDDARGRDRANNPPSNVASRLDGASVA